MSHPDSDSPPSGPPQDPPAKVPKAPIEARRPVAVSSQLKFSTTRGASVGPSPRALAAPAPVPAASATVSQFATVAGVVVSQEAALPHTPREVVAADRIVAPPSSGDAEADLNVRPTVHDLPKFAAIDDVVSEALPTVRRVVRGGSANPQADAVPPADAARILSPDVELSRFPDVNTSANPLRDVSVERRARANLPTEVLVAPVAVEVPRRNAATIQLDSQSEAPLSRTLGQRVAPPISTTRLDREGHARPAGRPAGAIATVLAVVAFIAALALPTADATPWALILYPTGVGFHALVMLLLLMAVGLSGFSPKSARLAYSVAGLLGLALAWFVMRDGVAADLFDGQPALFALWQGGGVAGLALSLGVTFLAAGAFARMHNPSANAPAIWLGLGFMAILVAIITAGAVDGASPMGSLFESFAKTAFVGDRIAVFALIPALVLVAPLLLVFKRNSFVAAGSTLAMGVVVAWAVPVIVLALYVAPAATWTLALAPLKVTFFLMGAVALAAMAGGLWAKGEV